jgi:hypothetical protein
MSLPSMQRVTFDTNVCNVIHDPSRWPNQVDPDDACKIRDAIRGGKLLGFVSEATLFIECLSFENKLAYLAVAGTDKVRPSLNPKAVARFKDVALVGARLLHAPLISAEIFIDGFNWADDDIFSAENRLSRFDSFCRPLGGLDKLKRYGDGLDEMFPLLFHETAMTSPLAWKSAFKRAWDADPSNRKKLRGDVGPIISEWCDGLIVGSHFAYGNDVFCTIDHGRTAGADSLLHPNNGAALQARGLTVMTPAEIVQHYGL